MTLVESLVQKLCTSGVTAFALNSPDEKNTTVTVTPYMGEVVGVDQAVIGDISRVQFYMRGAALDYPGAEAFAWRAYREALRIYESAELTEGYVSLEPLQAPTYLGMDDKERYLFSFNVPYRRTG
jgi:hypothetical protein